MSIRELSLYLTFGRFNETYGKVQILLEIRRKLTKILREDLAELIKSKPVSVRIIYLGVRGRENRVIGC
jgi:hypothetical protein